ncbi:MAG TPA: hypothetical protein VGA09_20235 [Candidatus Binatia bacterium]
MTLLIRYRRFPYRLEDSVRYLRQGKAVLVDAAQTIDLDLAIRKSVYPIL